MPTQIPSVTGLPGVSGPPDWLNPPPPLAGNYRLDDYRWFGATQRTFGGGASRSATFRAICDTAGAQPCLFLSMQANFVPALSDNRDLVHVGLQLANGSMAMVIRIQVHGPAPTGLAGAPLVNPTDTSHPPVAVHSVQVSTRASAASSWTVQSMAPAWINANTRAWLQSETDFPAPTVPNDPSNRWAVQMRIPLTNAADILNATGPNLGSAIPLWYHIQGAFADGSRLILAENITPATTAAALTTGNYPASSLWEPFVTGGGAGTTGGVTIFGNGWNDILVSNALFGEGTTIQNGAANAFIARPRNYRPAGNTIPASQINATFRMANWGSVANDPNQINFATGSWDYVPGNSALVPVPSNVDIPVLASGTNPPANTPIRLDVPSLNLGANQSRHQCIMATISGTSLNILAESAYRNMDFDHASLIEREAEINLENLTPFSAADRSIRLAIERVNMPSQTPAGYDEKQFLAATLDRLIKEGGDLAKKLGKVRSLLVRAGDSGSAKRRSLLVKALGESLDLARGRFAERPAAPLKSVLAAVESALTAAKDKGAQSDALAMMLDRFSDWLQAGPAEREAKLAGAVAALGTWLDLVRANPSVAKRILELVKTLQTWVARLGDGEILVQLLQPVEKYLASARASAAVLGSWQKLGGALTLKNGPVQTGLGSWLGAAGQWAKGQERLDTFLAALAKAGVTDGEIERIFPSLRIHVYYDTGERELGPDRIRQAVWRSQPSFGINAYAEGPITGWQVALEGAEKIGPAMYQMKIPNLGRGRLKVRLLAKGKKDQGFKEEPIVRPYPVK